MATQLDRIEQMLRTLCAHLGIRDVDQLGNGGSAESVAADGGKRYTGVVSRFEHGWGFIECEAMNRNFFVHFSDIDGTGLRSLDPGDVVSFEIAPGKDGRPKAVRVRRHSAGRPARTSRFEAIPRPAAHGNGSQGVEPEAEEAGAEENGLPAEEQSAES
ncbi:MAG TPA: cold shock domain-containing protein [Candidatus Acidoferrales bacterium]|nr:cold shock domain-containing protein [Candidatus Acidoferrales bacterium]